MTSYWTSIDTFSLFRTVLEIFHIKVFRVWPWPLTFSGHPRSEIFSPFESPYMTSYWTSIDTFSLFRTVFEIFDIKVFRVWPWPLTFRGHPRSKIFPPFESPYMISYLTSVHTFSLSRTVFEIFDFVQWCIIDWLMTSFLAITLFWPDCNVKLGWVNIFQPLSRLEDNIEQQKLYTYSGHFKSHWNLYIIGIPLTLNIR